MGALRFTTSAIAGHASAIAVLAANPVKVDRKLLGRIAFLLSRTSLAPVAELPRCLRVQAGYRRRCSLCYYHCRFLSSTKRTAIGTRVISPGCRLRSVSWMTENGSDNSIANNDDDSRPARASSGATRQPAPNLFWRGETQCVQGVYDRLWPDW